MDINSKLMTEIPEPPKDIVEWLKKRGAFSHEWLIFQCGWETELLTGIKSKCLDVICTHCGKKFKADRMEDVIDMRYPWTKEYEKYRGMAGNFPIQHGERSTCPICGVKTECVHVSAVGGGLLDSQWPLVFSRIGNNLVAAGYRAMRKVDKTGKAEFTVMPYEAYVFTDSKAYRFAGWHTGAFYGNKTLLGYWETRKQFSDCFGVAEQIYYTDQNIFTGTIFENCHLELYRDIAKKNFRPILYLNAFRKYPQIENLMVQGYSTLVNEYVSDRSFIKEAINWKEFSPKKMLGFTKTEFEFYRSQKLNSEEIMRINRFKKIYPDFLPSQVLAIVRKYKRDFDSLLQYGQPMKLIKFLEKQAKKENENFTTIFSDWKDYISMAAQVGYDIQSDDIRYPYKFFDAHERVVMAQKFTVDKKLMRKFDKMYEQLQPFTWEKGNLMIRPARNQEELIKEGAILRHCVGGYGEEHCEKGRPIFFIRHKDAPEHSYYTLQLDLKKMEIIQNRGYRNDRNQKKPPEVEQFAKEWINLVGREAKRAKKKSA